MLRQRILIFRTLAAATCAGLAASALLPGCTPDEDKNYGERARLAEGLDPGCINQCLYQKEGEPAAAPVDCVAAEQGLEFYPLPIWDFDGAGASNMYTYTDNSTKFLDPNGWEPRTEPVARCEGQDIRDNKALHIRGGPFVEWGGGMGRDMKCLNNSPILGKIKMAELGIEPNDRVVFAGDNPSTSNLCQSDDDCGPGLFCEAESETRSVCKPPPCEDDDDCTTKGWYCEGDNDPSIGADRVRRCRVYEPEPSCGAFPAPLRSEFKAPTGTTNEGACAPLPTRDTAPDDLEEDQFDEYLAYRRLIRSACPERDREAQERGQAAGAGPDEFMLAMTMDFSEWEGVSFWARRSPDSQAGIRFAMGDKWTDDDLNYLQVHINPDDERYCQRRLECFMEPDDSDTCRGGTPCVKVDFQGGPDPASGGVGKTGAACHDPQDCYSQSCVNGVCTEAFWCLDPERDVLWDGWDCEETDGRWSCVLDKTDPDGVWHPKCPDGVCEEGQVCSTYDFTPEDPDENERYCWNPLIDLVPDDPEPEFLICSGWGEDRDTQGDYACNHLYKPFQKADAQFWHRKCHDFAQTGSIVESYCYEPGVDPDPAEGLRLCGDHWMKPVYLSTEWEFYKIPFQELLQQGWAQESHRFDLTTAALMRFTWDRGWIDYWIDDVRVYRHKQD